MVHLSLPTPDGFPLSVDCFTPPAASQIKASCVIINATGVQARFYHDFARYLSQHDIAVLTFDYRFSGTSLPQAVLDQLKQAGDDEAKRDDIFHAALVSCPEKWGLMSHWTQQDLGTVVRYAQEQWRGKPMTLLGNSLGGHLATLLDEEILFPSSSSSTDTAPVRILNVCGGNAYWQNNPRPEEARFAFDELVVKPLETDRVFRASALGLGYDLPYGVGRDWLAWFYHPLFSLQAKKDEENARRVAKRCERYLYVGFEDDESISKNMMLLHLGLLDLSGNNVHSLWVDPPKAKPEAWPKCGHVTSFQLQRKKGVQEAEEHEASGAEGYQAAEEDEDEDNNESNEDSSSSKPPPSRLSREETVFVLYRDYILHGDIWKSAGEFRQWHPDDERDRHQIRRDEDQRRRKLRAEGKRATGDFAEDEEHEGTAKARL